MLTKRVRSEYMKKFRDPKWENGWDNSSESSGWSTPRPSRNRIAPLSLPKQKISSPGTQLPSEDRETEGGGGETVVDAAPAAAAVVVNGVNGSSSLSPDTSGPSEAESRSDPGPADTTSSDGEPLPGGEARRAQETPRAKSTPALCSKESLRASGRLDWSERQGEEPRARNNSHTSDACVQTTRRGSDKKNSNPERRRARSADLEKTRRSQLSVAGDRWVTEYMRCFSARLR
ncbi:hypothetical protein JOQ06_003973 [Pogonophryne albipinna]|uniref:Centriole, cilia and spindle-associated protein n=1 Tax=Pogonophryne albipinna TaxID=1090488 RepID=A0AAD6F1Y2_9TELE|nr:hypothetical protein JOQ06_003973 [Pogonophryne albipinna]